MEAKVISLLNRTASAPKTGKQAASHKKSNLLVQTSAGVWNVQGGQSHGSFIVRQDNLYKVQSLNVMRQPPPLSVPYTSALAIFQIIALAASVLTFTGLSMFGLYSLIH